MSVKFNIDKRKLEKAMKQQATNALHQRKYDVTCPIVEQKSMSQLVKVFVLYVRMKLT